MNPPAIVKRSPTPRVVAAPRVIVSVDPVASGHIGHEPRARFGDAGCPHRPIGWIVGPRAVSIERRMEVLQGRRIGVAIRLRVRSGLRWPRRAGLRRGRRRGYRRLVTGTRARDLLRGVRRPVDRPARVSARPREQHESRSRCAIEQLVCSLSFQHASVHCMIWAHSTLGLKHCEIAMPPGGRVAQKSPVRRGACENAQQRAEPRRRVAVSRAFNVRGAECSSVAASTPRAGRRVPLAARVPSRPAHGPPRDDLPRGGWQSTHRARQSRLE